MCPRPIVVGAATHIVPFGAPYVITLMAVARVAGVTPADVETRRRLLDSLRVNAP